VISLREHVGLLRGLLTGETACVGPFFVSIDLTRRCNLTCLHCRYHSCLSEYPTPVAAPLENMDYAVLSGLLAQLRACGTRDLIFAGEGEPLLYPHFREAVAAAKAAGLHVNVITNGTLLTDDLIEYLIDQRLDLLTVSLWASSPEEYARLYPGTRRDVFGRVLEGLRRVTAVKARKGSRFPRLRLHRPIGPDNYRGLEAALAQAREAGCDQFTVAPVHSLKAGTTAHRLLPDQETWVCDTLHRMKATLRRASMEHNFGMSFDLYRLGEHVWETTACYVGWVHSRVRVDGTVFTCGRCDIPVGNLAERPFREIWNDAPYRAFRRAVSTQEGLAGMTDHCRCCYCCHLRNSLTIHRVFRWMAPVAAGLRRAGLIRPHE
jgi:MoaA/NifB/PqqE/SkfB family radical SAM enzyme